MQITTTIKDETVTTLGLENIQAEIDNKALELDNRADAQSRNNLIDFLEANPDVKEAIKSKNNLDDSFKPLEVETPLQEVN